MEDYPNGVTTVRTFDVQAQAERRADEALKDLATEFAYSLIQDCGYIWHWGDGYGGYVMNTVVAAIRREAEVQ